MINQISNYSKGNAINNLFKFQFKKIALVGKSKTKFRNHPTNCDDGYYLKLTSYRSF